MAFFLKSKFLNLNYKIKFPVLNVIVNSNQLQNIIFIDLKESLKLLIADRNSTTLIWI